MKRALVQCIVVNLLPLCLIAQPVAKPFPAHIPSADQTPVTITTPGTEGLLTYLLQEFDGAAFPPAGWTSQGTGSAVWTRTTDASGYGIGVASALADFYSIQSGSFSLTTPAFSAAVAGDSLRFDHAYCTYQTENDRLQISTSTNGGSTWSTLIILDGGVSGPLVTAPAQTAPFVPVPSQWATKVYPLSPGVNRIRFTAISAYGNSLYLDNVLVGTPYTNDVGASTIDQPGTALPPGTYNPRVVVRNYGLAPQSFDVDLIITPGGYTATQSVSSLAPGATAPVTFPAWSPGVEGYTLTAVTRLATDENASNDTVTSFHIVSDISRGVLLEYCTGTWCQWCPCGDNTAATLRAAHPNLVVLAYHGPSTSTDPYAVFNGNTIIGLLGFSGYPTAMFDRANTPGAYTSWTGFAQNRYDNFSPTPIRIAVHSHAYDPGTRQLSITVGLTSNATLPFQYKVNAVITEDSLVYDQTGNTQCPGSDTWVHDWVVRNMVNTATGENVNTGTWNAGQTITRTFTTTLSPSWIPEHCNVNIFVYRSETFLGAAEVQNAITAPVIPVGTTQTYEYGMGWHLVSVPLAVEDTRATVLFPGAASQAYAYQGGYVARESLDVGSGYWLKFPAEQTVPMTGFPVDAETVEVAQGWNIVGSVTDTAAAADVTSLPPGILTSPFFGYTSSGYAPAAFLVPSRGYWLKTTQAGQIILRAQR